MLRVASPALRLAVVGAGPRGTSVLERLIASAALADAPVEVHMVDPAPMGGGRIWRHDQPAHLLMNTLCADATHFTDDSVRCEGPIVPGPTLYEWCRELAGGRASWQDPVVQAEAARVRPHSHPSRRLLGAYLRWCYLRDVGRLPEGWTLFEHRTRAVGCEPTTGGWRLRLGTGEALDVDGVVLATGHADLVTPRRAASRRDGAEPVVVVAPTNPIDADLSGLRPGSEVLVRGLGMNFFDVMSLLTVGRGGRFEPGAEEPAGADQPRHLTYHPSGEEPVLIVGSRRGTPYRAKGVFGRMTPYFPPRFLTAEVVDALAARGGVDFVRDLWPLIAKDGAYVYYRVLADNDPDQFADDPGQVLTALDSTPWGDPELQALIASTVPDRRHRLDYATWDRPLTGRTFASPQALRIWWLDDLRRDLDEAHRGMRSAVKCAGLAVGQGRSPLRTLVRYGGLLGRSYKDDVLQWFKGFAGSLASGPPAGRIAELIALVHAGLVRPLGPGMAVTVTDDAITGASPQVAGSTVRTTALLEAHLPPPCLARTANPVLADLRDRGLARSFAIPDDGGVVVTGAVEVTPAPYRLVSASGAPLDGLYAVGVPLEGVHYGTELGPLAQTNSQFLRETDAVARALLGTPVRQHGDPERAPGLAGSAEEYVAG